MTEEVSYSEDFEFSAASASIPGHPTASATIVSESSVISEVPSEVEESVRSEIGSESALSSAHSHSHSNGKAVGISCLNSDVHGVPSANANDDDDQLGYSEDFAEQTADYSEDFADHTESKISADCSVSGEVVAIRKIPMDERREQIAKRMAEEAKRTRIEEANGGRDESYSMPENINSNSKGSISSELTEKTENEDASERKDTMHEQSDDAAKMRPEGSISSELTEKTENEDASERKDTMHEQSDDAAKMRPEETRQSAYAQERKDLEEKRTRQVEMDEIKLREEAEKQRIDEEHWEKNEEMKRIEEQRILQIEMEKTKRREEDDAEKQRMDEENRKKNEEQKRIEDAKVLAEVEARKQQMAQEQLRIQKCAEEQRILQIEMEQKKRREEDAEKLRMDEEKRKETEKQERIEDAKLRDQEETRKKQFAEEQLRRIKIELEQADRKKDEGKKQMKEAKEQLRIKSELQDAGRKEDERQRRLKEETPLRIKAALEEAKREEEDERQKEEEDIKRAAEKNRAEAEQLEAKSLEEEAETKRLLEEVEIKRAMEQNKQEAKRMEKEQTKREMELKLVEAEQVSKQMQQEAETKLAMDLVEQAAKIIEQERREAERDANRREEDARLKLKEIEVENQQVRYKFDDQARAHAEDGRCANKSERDRVQLQRLSPTAKVVEVIQSELDDKECRRRLDSRTELHSNCVPRVGPMSFEPPGWHLDSTLQKCAAKSSAGDVEGVPNPAGACASLGAAATQKDGSEVDRSKGAWQGWTGKAADFDQAGSQSQWWKSSWDEACAWGVVEHSIEQTKTAWNDGPWYAWPDTGENRGGNSGFWWSSSFGTNDNWCDDARFADAVDDESWPRRTWAWVNQNLEVPRDNTRAWNAVGRPWSSPGDWAPDKHKTQKTRTTHDEGVRCDQSPLQHLYAPVSIPRGWRLTALPSPTSQDVPQNSSVSATCSFPCASFHLNYSPDVSPVNLRPNSADAQVGVARFVATPTASSELGVSGLFATPAPSPEPATSPGSQVTGATWANSPPAAVSTTSPQFCLTAPLAKTARAGLRPPPVLGFQRPAHSPVDAAVLGAGSVSDRPPCANVAVADSVAAKCADSDEIPATLRMDRNSFAESMAFAVATVADEMIQMRYGWGLHVPDFVGKVLCKCDAYSLLSPTKLAAQLHARSDLWFLDWKQEKLLKLQISCKETWNFSELLRRLRFMHGTASAVAVIQGAGGANVEVLAAFRVACAGSTGAVGRCSGTCTKLQYFDAASLVSATAVDVEIIASRRTTGASVSEPPPPCTAEFAGLEALLSGSCSRGAGSDLNMNIGATLGPGSDELPSALLCVAPSHDAMSRIANVLERPDVDAEGVQELFRKILGWLSSTDSVANTTCEAFAQCAELQVAVVTAMHRCACRKEASETACQLIGVFSRRRNELACRIASTGGVSEICRILERHPQDKDIQRHGLHALGCLAHFGCAASEAVSANGISHALRSMGLHRQSPSVQIASLELLRVLADQGGASTNGLAQAAQDAKRAFPRDLAVHRAANMLLSFVVPRMAAGIGALMDAVPNDEATQRCGMCSLGQTAKYGGVAWRGAATSAVGRVMRAMQRHVANPEVQAVGLWALAQLAERVEAPSAGMQDAAERAKQRHPNSALVRRHADELSTLLLRP